MGDYKHTRGRRNLARFSLTLNDEMRRRLVTYRNRFRLRSLNQTINVMLHVVSFMLEEARTSAAKGEGLSTEDEIRQMFDELSSVEPQPDGTVPVRHPNRDRYGKG